MRNEKSGYERYVDEYFQRQRDMEDEEKQTNEPAEEDVSRLSTPNRNVRFPAT